MAGVPFLVIVARPVARPRTQCVQRLPMQVHISTYISLYTLLYLSSLSPLYIYIYIYQWLKYCAEKQKVAGSIPDVVMEFFIHINPSDRTMALGVNVAGA
jgi:hypothetical protein